MITRSMSVPFRQQLHARKLLLGTFVKTPHPSIVEVLGLSPLDFVCLDAEHAPFDRAALDTAILAGRAAALPTLVRIQRADPCDILNALDLGANGILIPHVACAESARAVAAAARYGHGGRGYAGSTRAAAYTTRSMRENISEANALVTVIAQIEDAEALEHLDAIAGVPGIDALFVGRMDLTVSLGAGSPDDPVVIDAVKAICSAGRRRNLPVGMFTASNQEARTWRSEGASFFILASDQQWILQGARALMDELGDR